MPGAGIAPETLNHGRICSAGHRALREAPSRGRGRVCNFGGERIEQNLDPTPRDVPGDENHAASSISGRPAVEPGGRVEDGLYAVDHGRPLRALGNIHDALQPQQIPAAMFGQRFKKERQRNGLDRLRAHNRICLDLRIMVFVRMIVRLRKL